MKRKKKKKKFSQGTWSNHLPAGWHHLSIEFDDDTYSLGKSVTQTLNMVYKYKWMRVIKIKWMENEWEMSKEMAHGKNQTSSNIFVYVCYRVWLRS